MSEYELLARNLLNLTTYVEGGERKSLGLYMGKDEELVKRAAGYIEIWFNGLTTCAAITGEVDTTIGAIVAADNMKGAE